MQFLVTGKDYADASARRLAARERHLARGQTHQREGKLVVAAAILDDAGRMIGSTMLYDCASRAELDELLASEPYVCERVWEHVTVEPCRLGPAFTHLAGSSSTSPTESTGSHPARSVNQA